MKTPLDLPEPTEVDKLWELFWAVNEYINSDGSFDKIDDTFQWLNNWLMENSDETTPRNEDKPYDEKGGEEGWTT